MIFSLPKSRLSVVSVAVSARDASVSLPRTYRYIKVEEVAKGLEAGNGRLVRRQPLFDRGLRLTGLSVGVVAAEERLARVAALSSDLEPVGSEGSLVMEAIFICAVCAMSRRRGVNSAILGRISA